MDINIRELCVAFINNGKQQIILKNVNLYLPQGKVTAIVGESGSGKSVLGTALVKLLGPQAVVTGQILYGEDDILSLGEEDMTRVRGKHISWMAQNPVTAMNPLQKVGSFVTEILGFRENRSDVLLKERGIEQLKHFGLQNAESVYQSYPVSLSGGMAQRALISAMTIEEPEWLIADEPTKGLDAMVRKQVYENLRQLSRERKMGMILITHDLRLAERLSDYVAVMYAGEIIEYTDTKLFFTEPGHPYSRGLINAQPDKTMQPIPGDNPNLMMTEESCAFASRCIFFCEKCREKQKMFNRNSHYVRCWRYLQ